VLTRPHRPQGPRGRVNTGAEGRAAVSTPAASEGRTAVSSPLWKASQEQAKVAEREELEAQPPLEAQRRVDELEQQSKKWVGGKRQEEEKEEEEEEEERVKTPSWRRRAGQNAQLKEEEEEEEEEEKEEKLRKQTHSIINNLTPRQREQFQKLINSTPEHVR
jgi:hypothetical protein